MIEQDADSELEYRIRSIQPRNKRSIVQICRLELLKPNRGTPRNINVMLRSEQNHFMPLDTGSPGCFLNKQTADILLRHNPQFVDVQNLPNEFSYEDYNTDSIKVFGSLSIPISSGGWRKFITPFSWCRRLELVLYWEWNCNAHSAYTQFNEVCSLESEDLNLTKSVPI